MASGHGLLHRAYPQRELAAGFVRRVCPSRFLLPALLRSTVVTRFTATMSALTAAGRLFGPRDHEHRPVSDSSLIFHINPSLSACPNHTSNDQGPGFDMLSAVLDLQLLPQASPFPSRLAPCSHRIGFTFVQAHSSASSCFPPRLTATQFPSAADDHAVIGLRLSRAEFMYVMTH